MVEEAGIIFQINPLIDNRKLIIMKSYEVGVVADYLID